MGFGDVIRCARCSGSGVSGLRGRFDIQTGNGRGFHVLKKKNKTKNGGGNKRDNDDYTY